MFGRCKRCFHDSVFKRVKGDHAYPAAMIHIRHYCRKDVAYLRKLAVNGYSDGLKNTFCRMLRFAERFCGHCGSYCVNKFKCCFKWFFLPFCNDFSCDLFRPSLFAVFKKKYAKARFRNMYLLYPQQSLHHLYSFSYQEARSAYTKSLVQQNQADKKKRRDQEEVRQA